MSLTYYLSLGRLYFNRFNNYVYEFLIGQNTKEKQTLENLIILNNFGKNVLDQEKGFDEFAALICGICELKKKPWNLSLKEGDKTLINYYSSAINIIFNNGPYKDFINLLDVSEFQASGHVLRSVGYSINDISNMKKDKRDILFITFLEEYNARFGFYESRKEALSFLIS